MREEINNWINQSRHDLEIAKHNFDGKYFDAAAFYCQQSVEKGLKAVYIFKNKSFPPKIHDLVELCRLIKAPDEITSNAGKLVSAYIFSRYPGTVPDVPEKYYNKKKAEEYLKFAKEILEWIKEQIKL